MKIVVNAQFLTQKITGIQRYAMEISRELKRIRGIEIKFVAPKNIVHNDLAKYLEVEVIGDFAGILWEQIDLPLYLSGNNNPVLLNMRNTAPLFYKKSILVMHDLIFIKDKKWFSKKNPFIYRFCAPILLKNALKIITVSNFSKQDIVKTFNIFPEKIEIVSNAVSRDLQGYAEEEFENEYGNYILAVASFLSPRKNIFNLIKAFKKLQNSDLKLIIVGAEIKNFSEKGMPDKNVIFTGEITDKKLAGLYKNAKLLAFPSLYEGFGVPPLEAMSFGCPVLASNITSLPEVCGDAAYYVNPYSIDEIVHGIDKILNDEELRNNLIQNGYKRQADFSWENSAGKLISIIKSLSLSE